MQGLVLRFMNTVAFEARCIRPGFVALPHRTCPVRLGRDALPDAAHRPSRCDTVFMKRNTQVDGGRKPRGCCARAAETFRPVTPGTLIRTKIAAASNRDKKVAATTVITALIYTNGHPPPGSVLNAVPPQMPCRRSS